MNDRTVYRPRTKTGLIIGLAYVPQQRIYMSNDDLLLQAALLHKHNKDNKDSGATLHLLTSLFAFVSFVLVCVLAS